MALHNYLHTITHTHTRAKQCALLYILMKSRSIFAFFTPVWDNGAGASAPYNTLCLPSGDKSGPTAAFYRAPAVVFLLFAGFARNVYLILLLLHNTFDLSFATYYRRRRQTTKRLFFAQRPLGAMATTQDGIVWKRSSTSNGAHNGID